VNSSQLIEGLYQLELNSQPTDHMFKSYTPGHLEVIGPSFGWVADADWQSCERCGFQCNVRKAADVTASSMSLRFDLFHQLHLLQRCNL